MSVFFFRNNDFYGICLNRVEFHAREIKLSSFSELSIAHVFNRVSSSNVPNSTFLCIMFATLLAFHATSSLLVILKKEIS